MTYTLVEDYSTDGTTARLAARSYPLPSLVEDGDGIRILLIRAEDVSGVPARVWHDAHIAGASALIAPVSEDLWRYALAEDFIAGRSEQARGQVYLYDGWLECDGLPGYLSYRDMVGRFPAGEDRAVEIDTGLPYSANPFVHLHTHSEYSALDGLSKISEMVETVVADGQKALGIADHGNCAGHPELQSECDKAGIKPVFAMEAYFVPDRHRRARNWEEPDEHGNMVRKSDHREARGEYQHLVLIAQNDVGLRNLWAMSTEAYIDGLYDGKPRLDWDTLTRFREGVIATTACLRGPLARPILEGHPNVARTNLARLLDIFGDRLYIEVHCNHLPEQVEVNHALVAFGKEVGVPLVAAMDSHYPCKDDQQVHQQWLRMNTGKDNDEEVGMFGGGQDYHLATKEEVRAALAYLGPDVADEAVRNTSVIANQCTARVAGVSQTPTFSKGANAVERDVERLLDLCLANWQRKVVGKAKPEAVYEERFEREMRLLVNKEFCGYFLIVNDYVAAAKNRSVAEGGPILVGPGRGSGGGSLVAYLADIVEIDPVDADLLFERFLTEGRTSLPDFDIDFPQSERDWLKGYVARRWGVENVVTIGTVLRMQAKSAINKVNGLFKDETNYMEIEKVKKAISDIEAGLAGKHLDWEEFWAEHEEGEIAAIRQKYPQVFGLADRVVGRIYSYGKHAAGVVISTDEPLIDRLPLRLGDNGEKITQWDMVALELMGYVKFDLLTLRTLDTIQQAIEMAVERFLVKIGIYDWKAEYDDPQVWDEICEGHTLGLFQIETRAGTRLTRRFKPRSLHDLAAVMTLVRPGPVRSGLTETYLRRRDGAEPVTFPDPRLEAVLGETFGCIIYQEDVMNVCMALGGYDGNEADEVRSILGKKKVEKVAEAGSKFLARVKATGTDESVAVLLWDQMAEFAKYSFNKAHAYGYAVLGYWTAWLKFHYPVQFLTAALSTVDAERIPEFINEARRMGYAIMPPDINESRVGFTPGQMAVRYGFLGVATIGDVTAESVVRGQPYASFEDFMERVVSPKGSKVNIGHVRTLVQVGAFDSLHPNRRALEHRVEQIASGDDERCQSWDQTVILPHGLPCRFDWANEPVPVGRKGQPLKAKPLPKKCTKACRNYVKRGVVEIAVEPYTDADIREKEKTLLGVYLSSTPFDRIDPEDLALCHTAEEIDAGPEGEYTVAAIVTSAREAPRPDKNGNRYGFVTLNCQNGDVDCIVFSSNWEKFRADLRPDALIVALVWKNDRGCQLTHMMPARA